MAWNASDISLCERYMERSVVGVGVCEISGHRWGKSSTAIKRSHRTSKLTLRLM